MQEEVLERLLVELLGKWGGGAKFVAKKLKTESVTTERIIPKECSFQDIISQVKTCGTLITENEEEKTAGFVVMSGKANMNPVIVALKQDGNKVIAKAYAKEGLIKQHTAEKSVERVLDVLG